MPLKNYGVLKGKAIDKKTATSQNEHFQILIDADGTLHRIAINVKSNLAPHEVMFYAHDDLRHEITDVILNAQLQNGYTPVPSQHGGIALDFIRRNLFDINELTPLPSRQPGDNNDLNEKFDFYVSQAISEPDAVVYAFGEKWGPEPTTPDKYFGFKPGNGIHDIHMNQGNPKGKYDKDNGVWQDGGILIHFAASNKWFALFTAFQSQAFHTHDTTGHPLTDLPVHDDAQPEFATPVRIIAALVNPHDGDAGKEYVILLNKSASPVNLDGWKILDKSKKNADVITGKMIAAGETLRINLTGKGAQLSNKGGIITLLNKEGLKVDGVTYTKKDATTQGEVVEL